MDQSQLQQLWMGERKNPLQSLKPYRVAVFTNWTEGKGKRQRTCGAGWIAWNPYLTEHWAHMGRLISNGSFQWLGYAQALLAVRQAFDDPKVHQVQIRTDQDRKLAIFNRYSNGEIASYAE